MKSEFLNPLRLEQIGWSNGRPKWTLLAPLRYRSKLLGITVLIPEGFKTDLASVPRLLLSWFVAGGRAPRPAVLHDYGYQHGTFIIDHTNVLLQVTRQDVDAVLYEAMRADPIDGSNRITANLIWSSVRLFGWASWKGE